MSSSMQIFEGDSFLWKSKKMSSSKKERTFKKGRLPVPPTETERAVRVHFVMPVMVTSLDDEYEYVDL